MPAKQKQANEEIELDLNNSEILNVTRKTPKWQRRQIDTGVLCVNSLYASYVIVAFKMLIQLGEVVTNNDMIREYLVKPSLDDLDYLTT